LIGKKYKNIIWDWNGTLLNDISICIQSMNYLLGDRNLPLLNENIYRDIFTFPVQNYYERIGFDFTTEKFDIPALQFIEYYKKYLPTVELFPEVEYVLQYFSDQNMDQYILSAMEQDSLRNSVNNLNISTYFNKIYGIPDHFARGKIERGLQLIQSEKLNPNETVMVGDTLHDIEVAEMLGIDCVLVAQGHQAKDRLLVNGNTVINNLVELKNIL